MRETPLGNTPYMYRPPSHYGGLGCPKFRVNGGEATSLANGGFVRFEVPAGAHQITTETSWCYVFPLELAVEIGAQEVVFVRYTQSPTWAPGSHRGTQRDDLWTRLERVSADKALAELKSR